MSVRAVDNWWTRWQTGGRDALADACTT
ncbi:hypothetical protein AB8O64_10780 [Streptomyces sp. QH1-20]